MSTCSCATRPRRHATVVVTSGRSARAVARIACARRSYARAAVVAARHANPGGAVAGGEPISFEGLTGPARVAAVAAVGTHAAARTDDDLPRHDLQGATAQHRADHVSGACQAGRDK